MDFEETIIFIVIATTVGLIVLVSVRKIVLSRDSIYHMDPLIIRTPHVKMTTPFVLHKFRIVAFCWCVYILVEATLTLGWLHMISYYTMWNFTLLTIYFGLAASLGEAPAHPAPMSIDVLNEPAIPNSMFGKSSNHIYIYI